MKHSLNAIGKASENTLVAYIILVVANSGIAIPVAIATFFVILLEFRYFFRKVALSVLKWPGLTFYFLTTLLL